MSNYPDGFDTRLLDEAPERDTSDLDTLCDEAEAALANFSIGQVSSAEYDTLFDLATRMSKAIAEALPAQDSYDFEQDEYRDRLGQSHPKLHALLEAQ